MNDFSTAASDSKKPFKPTNEFLRSQKNLQALFDNLPVAIYLVTPQYILTEINKIRAGNLNKPPATLLNQPCYQALFSLSAPCPSCRLSETLLEGKRTKRYERRVSENGTYSDLEISTFPVYGENDLIEHVMILEQDITEKRHLENILSQSEKLAIIGQLAAGVAHELNNPLTAILANAQIIQRGLSKENDLQESVDLIIRAGERAAQVVQNLLDFARKEDFHLEPTDIHMTLQRSIELIKHELVTRRVSLEFLPDSNLPTILASEDHLQSVWLNLLMNAIDSMDKSPAHIQLTTHKDENSVLISFSDNGKGISAEILNNIFEPFYTTKAPGKGTGLGLSISQRIVKQHGGSIQVKSQPGNGSEFIVTLPIISTGFPDE